MSEIQQQVADGARPLARVGDVIQPGWPIPANVVRLSDVQGFDRHARGRGLARRIADGTMLADWFPMTVTEVDPEPQPTARRLVGPPHAHLDAPCTDACYEPAGARDDDGFLRLKGTATGDNQLDVPQPAETPERKAERHALNRPLGKAFDRLAAEARIAQAHNEHGMPLWIHLCGYVEAFRNVPLDEAPFGGGCDECDSGYPQPGDWRPLLAGASHRPPGPSKPAAEPGPVVLSLPQVPDGAVALVGIESGQRWEPLGTAWWNDEKRVQRYLSDVLREEGRVTVEFAPPREPRVWPKLDTLDPADDDPMTVDVEGRGRWVWDNGRGLYGDGIGDWCSLRELQHLGEVREVLT